MGHQLNAQGAARATALPTATAAQRAVEQGHKTPQHSISERREVENGQERTQGIVPRARFFLVEKRPSPVAPVPLGFLSTAVLETSCSLLV